MMQNRGIAYAILAYCLWGLSPIFWKQISHISAIESVLHRTVWSFLILGAILIYRRRWEWLKLLKNRRIFSRLFLATLLLAINWILYIWAVIEGFIVEASLGYFINPLVSVIFAVLFLRETLRSWQWAAIGLALCGVLYLTFGYGSFPWIGLTLAFSFAIYGFMKKQSPLDAITGLSVEISLMFPIALVMLLYMASQGDGAFGRVDLATNIFLIGTGLVTIVPLLLFAMGARRIPLAYMGLLQYIAPSMQLLIGTFVYGEGFSWQQGIGYGMIWTALLILAIEGIWQTRRTASLAVA